MRKGIEKLKCKIKRYSSYKRKYCQEIFVDMEKE